MECSPLIHYIGLVLTAGLNVNEAVASAITDISGEGLVVPFTVDSVRSTEVMVRDPFTDPIREALVRTFDDEQAIGETLSDPSVLDTIGPP